jgi:hypothetical protein
MDAGERANRLWIPGDHRREFLNAKEHKPIEQRGVLLAENVALASFGLVA